MPHNIEKSAFRRGEYVGYGGGFVWNIIKINSACGKWQAEAQKNGAKVLRFANTLASLSKSLDFV